MLWTFLINYDFLSLSLLPSLLPPSLPLPFCLTCHPLPRLCGQNWSPLWWHRAYSPGQPEAALLHWQGWTHVPLHPQLPQDVQAPHPRWLQSECLSILENCKFPSASQHSCNLAHTMNAKAAERPRSPALLESLKTVPRLERKCEGSSKQSSIVMRLLITGCGAAPLQLLAARDSLRYVRRVTSLN